MAKLAYTNSITNVILRVKILDSSSATGGGKIGLTAASNGLVISTIADTEATPTTYRQANGTIENIATLGTFAAPTSGRCRFSEVDPQNHPGLYELQFADTRWSVAGARSVIVSIHGAAGAAPVDLEVQLDSSAAMAALSQDIDSTGAAPLSVKKALEVMLAVLAGVATFDTSTGVESFKGRDGSTTIVANTLTGSGTRTQSTIS